MYSIIIISITTVIIISSSLYFFFRIQKKRLDNIVRDINLNNDDTKDEKEYNEWISEHSELVNHTKKFKEVKNN